MEKGKVVKKLKVYAGLFVLVTSLGNLKIDRAEAATNYGSLRSYTAENNQFNIKDFDIIMHIVEKDETIFSIANKYGVTVQSIIDDNYFKSGSGYYLYNGEELIVKRTLSYEKDKNELSIYNEEKPKMEFSINGNGDVYVRLTKEFSKEKDTFLNKKVASKLPVKTYYKVEGLIGKTMDITNIKVKGRVDDIIFLQDNGTLQHLDINKIYNEGVIVATPAVPNYDKCMYFQQNNAYVDGKKREVNVVIDGVEKSIPTYKQFKKLEKNEQETLAKTYKDLNVDTMGNYRLEFGITKSGKVVVKTGGDFGTDRYNFASQSILNKFEKNGLGHSYNVEGLEGNVVDITNLHYGINGRTDDFYFLLDNGRIQLLDMDKLYNEGVFAVTRSLDGYYYAKEFLIGKTNVNGFITNTFVQVLDNNEVKNLPTFEEYNVRNKCKVYR